MYLCATLSWEYQCLPSSYIKYVGNSVSKCSTVLYKYAAYGWFVAISILYYKL